MLKIDHLLICIDAPEKMAKILTDFGLIEGESNSHFGQGTSNRRFYFNNIYLELLYLDDPEAAQSPLTKPIKIFQRFLPKTTNISPFAVCFYADNQIKNNDKFDINKFKNWSYKPKYLPSPLKIDILEAPISEPMYFFLDFISSDSRKKHKKFKHKTGFKNVTNIKYHTPHHHLDSDIKTYISEHNLLEYIANDTHIFHLEFDAGAQGKTHDFRPDLPLIFSW
ncbi:MAG: glyoxalase-like domain protein [Hyphomicrobiales bacterium]|nr:MAG: glyoxalase-like domain protein [Hyphomicrobiales bacterium]